MTSRIYCFCAGLVFMPPGVSTQRQSELTGPFRSDKPIAPLAAPPNPQKGKMSDTPKKMTIANLAEMERRIVKDQLPPGP